MILSSGCWRTPTVIGPSCAAAAASESEFSSASRKASFLGKGRRGGVTGRYLANGLDDLRRFSSTGERSTGTVRFSSSTGAAAISARLPNLPTTQNDAAATYHCERAEVAMPTTKAALRRQMVQRRGRTCPSP